MWLVVTLARSFARWHLLCRQRSDGHKVCADTCLVKKGALVVLSSKPQKKQLKERANCRCRGRFQSVSFAAPVVEVWWAFGALALSLFSLSLSCLYLSASSRVLSCCRPVAASRRLLPWRGSSGRPLSSRFVRSKSAAADAERGTLTLRPLSVAGEDCPRNLSGGAANCCDCRC